MSERGIKNPFPLREGVGVRSTYPSVSLIYASIRSRVAVNPFKWVRSMPWLAETPGPISPTRISYPAINAIEPSEP